MTANPNHHLQMYTREQGGKKKTKKPSKQNKKTMAWVAKYINIYQNMWNMTLEEGTDYGRCVFYICIYCSILRAPPPGLW